MKIRSTSIAALVAVPLALAGCAADPAPPPQAPATPPQAARPSPEGVAWTGKLCGLVGGFAAAQQRLPGVDKTSTDTLKKTVVERIDSASRSADDTIRGLQGLGPSPIAGADQVNDGFQQGFTQVRDLLAAAGDKAKQVDPTNKQRFQEGMTGVQQELQKGQQLNLQDKLVQLEQNNELKTAAQQAPECKQFFTQPRPQ
ncbi:hypothetical protein [Saccharopolyspora phatthalungensis]|uniref:Small secreted protein n=1 Tax=Saccharopolyspora phatthalungensis TaxID=664693 RepID=A0A840PUL4_9PSEU|nr:hypothetical protein [Saccharopolyspora phatthalungensis]MBB5153982.1 hypothetical protein [Saccharopolyspora phatthalungensis]